jgi:hypothetical protein
MKSEVPIPGWSIGKAHAAFSVAWSMIHSSDDRMGGGLSNRIPRQAEGPLCMVGNKGRCRDEMVWATDHWYCPSCFTREFEARRDAERVDTTTLDAAGNGSPKSSVSINHHNPGVFRSVGSKGPQDSSAASAARGSPASSRPEHSGIGGIK